LCWAAAEVIRVNFVGSVAGEQVRSDITQGLTKGSKTMWSPGILRYVFMAMGHLPRPIWRNVSAG